MIYLRKFLRVIVNIIFALFYKVEVVNNRNVPEKGAALLCANHISEFDMFFIGYGIRRWVHYIAKEELFKNPVFGWILRKLGAFPVKRGKGDIGAIRTALRLLDEGHIVGIFPEGTRTKDKNRKNIKIKPGVAMIAINSAVPVIPVALQGSFKPFSHVKVIYGEPFELNLDKNRKYTNEELTEISRSIMDRVYSLMEE